MEEQRRREIERQRDLGVDMGAQAGVEQVSALNQLLSINLLSLVSEVLELSGVHKIYYLCILLFLLQMKQDGE